MPVLTMSRPWKHPKTGVYFARKAVPADLRKVLGWELKRSLGTTNAAEARRLHPAVLAEFDQRIAAERSGPAPLTVSQVMALAGEVRAGLLAEYANDPAAGLGDWEATATGWEAADDEIAEALQAGKVHPVVVERVAMALRDRHLKPDAASLAKLHVEAAGALMAACRILAERCRGDFAPDTGATAYPTWGDPAKASAGASFDAILDAWEGVRKPVARTAYQYRRIADQLAGFVNHRDAARVTKINAADWRDAMLKAGRSQKTVEVALIAMRAVFARAATDGRIPANPFAGIGTGFSKKAKQRGNKAYSEDQARTLLLAARNEDGAVRWLPWALAFTGARVNEVAQAGAADVGESDGVPFLDINAEGDGKSVKNASSVRRIPLHSALIAEGFLAYARSLPKDGPLFPDLPPGRFKKRGDAASKRLGRFTRKVLPEVKDKQPAHAWRHRFIDLCRENGVPQETRDRLTGHANDTNEGVNYGGRSLLRLLCEAVEKLPSPL